MVRRDDGGRHDLWVSVLTATLVELPLAVILITPALRIFTLRASPSGVTRATKPGSRLTFGRSGGEVEVDVLT